MFGEFFGTVSVFDFHLACLQVIKLITFYFMGHQVCLAMRGFIIL